MRILHENSVILDFQFLQLHCFQKTYWTGIQVEDQKAGNSANCRMLVLVLVMSPVLPAANFRGISTFYICPELYCVVVGSQDFIYFHLYLYLLSFL